MRTQFHLALLISNNWETDLQSENTFNKGQGNKPGVHFSKVPLSLDTQKAAAKLIFEPCDNRAAFFTYPHYEQGFPSCKKFQLYTILHF